MPKDDQDDRRVVIEVLEATGLSVECIPESAVQTCDMRATCNKEEYLLEVKGVRDALALGPTLRKGKVFSEMLAFDSARAVESGIDKAVGQLQSTAASYPDHLHILALRVVSRYNPTVVVQQILGRLLGKRGLIVPTDNSGHSKLIECLYFSHSAFFKYRLSLDGALLIDPDGVSLWTNDFSGRASRVCRSTLGLFLDERGAMNNAARLEAEGFLLADCNLDRRDQDGVLEYVATKYGLEKPIVANLSRYSAMVEAPDRPPRSRQ